MFRLFRLVIEFPALDQFTAALNRFMDGQDSDQQKEIDELTARLRDSSADLKASVDQTTKEKIND